MSNIKDYKGQSAIAGVAISMLIFLIIIVITAEVVAAGNYRMFSDGTTNLLDLIPIVLIGAAVVSVLVTAFRLSA